MRSKFLAFAGLFAAITLAFGTTMARAQRSDTEVKVAVDGGKSEGGKQVITVQLDVNKGWHIYANPVGNEDLAGAATVVNVTGKAKPASVKVTYPKAHVIDDKVLGKYGTYEGKVTITATVQRAEGDTGPLEVSVRFQACDSKTCLPLANVKKKVP